MKVTLTRTGGFIPIVKKVTTDVDWSADDIEVIATYAQTSPGDEALLRDGLYYTLEAGGKKFAFDPNKAPGSYKTVIDSLIKDLVIVK